MEIAVVTVGLVAVVLAVAHLAKRIGQSAPLLLVAVGAAVSFIPGFPALNVPSEVVLLGLLPPLLYAAASNTSLIDLRRDKGLIIGQAVMLVIVTALAVALVGWSFGVPFAYALALGGIVAPPDAVAATAVARSIGLPRRVVSILEGESLFNDATALVIVSTALGLEAATVQSTVLGFVWASLGGVLIGVVVYKLITLVRRRLTDAVTEVGLTFLVPWLAYVPAEEVGASGVIATVACGVLLAHTSANDLTAQARLAERINWGTIQYLLENLVFLLIGLQTATIIRGLQDDATSTTHGLLLAGSVFVAVLLSRPLWILAWAWVRRHLNRPGSISFRESVVVSWAGMRGVVTLAAAFLLPQGAPYRASLVFAALVVTVGTLVLQGFTLGGLARALHLHGPDPREDALQMAQLTQAVVQAGSARLDEELAKRDEPLPASLERSLRGQGLRRANLAWEQLGRDTDACTPTDQYRQLRLAMLESERTKVLKLRDKGIMDHEVLRAVLGSLDIEESMLARSEERTEETNRRLLLTPENRQGGCEHLRADLPPVEPSNHDGCVECEAAGQNWVALRMCLVCGNVACCDSSEGKHATRHYEQTGHPVMRSFEPGEAWRWCYVDTLLG